MKDFLFNSQIFVTHKPAPPLTAKGASMLWSALSGLAMNLTYQKCAPQNYKRGGGGPGGSEVVWLGPKSGGWVSSEMSPLLNEAWAGSVRVGGASAGPTATDGGRSASACCLTECDLMDVHLVTRFARLSPCFFDLVCHANAKHTQCTRCPVRGHVWTRNVAEWEPDRGPSGVNPPCHVVSMTGIRWCAVHLHPSMLHSRQKGFGFFARLGHHGAPLPRRGARPGRAT